MIESKLKANNCNRGQLFRPCWVFMCSFFFCCTLLLHDQPTHFHEREGDWKRNILLGSCSLTHFRKCFSILVKPDLESPYLPSNTTDILKSVISVVFFHSFFPDCKQSLFSSKFLGVGLSRRKTSKSASVTMSVTCERRKTRAFSGHWKAGENSSDACATSGSRHRCSQVMVTVTLAFCVLPTVFGKKRDCWQF